MSTSIMAACWPLQMPSTAKAVLMSLADNANDQGLCWPAIDTIAKRTCLHRSNVIKAIQKLEQLGHVVADRTNGRHTRYTITPSLDLFTDAKPVAERYPSRNATGSATRLNPSRSATGPVAERDTNRQEPSRTVNGVSPAHAREAAERIDSSDLKNRVASTCAREATVQASVELRKHGVRVTPSNPDLIAAVSEGVTPSDLVELAEAHPGKPLAYLTTIARRERAEGPKPISQGNPYANRNSRGALSAADRVALVNAEAVRRGRIIDAEDGGTA